MVPQAPRPHVLLLAALLACVAVVAGVLPARALTLAVARFTPHTTAPEWEPLGRGLADMLTTDLVGLRGVQVVERARLDAVLAELGLQQSAFVDPATAQKLGQGVAATHVLVGDFLLSGVQLRLNARLVEVATGTVVLAAESQGPQADVFAAEKVLVDRLARTLKAQWQPPPKPPRVSTADLRDLGQGLADLDAGRLEAARKTLEGLSARRPDLGLARQAREQLQRKVDQRLLQQAEAARALPAGLLARMDQLAAGDTRACEPFRQGVMALVTTLSQGLTARISGQPQDPSPLGLGSAAPPPDVERVLGAVYGLVQRAVAQPKLAEPICAGQRPAAELLTMVFVFLGPNVRGFEETCNPVLVAGSPDPKLHALRCEGLTRNLPAVRDAAGQVVVASDQLLGLCLAWGQILMERLPPVPAWAQHVTETMSALLAAQALRDLPPDQQKTEIGRRQTVHLRKDLRLHGSLPVAMLAVLPALGGRKTLAVATLSLVGKLPEHLAVAGLDLSVDAGATWRPWPDRQAPVGFVYGLGPGDEGWVQGPDLARQQRLVPAAMLSRVDAGVRQPQPQFTPTGRYQTLVLASDRPPTEADLAPLRLRLSLVDGTSIDCAPGPPTGQIRSIACRESP